MPERGAFLIEEPPAAPPTLPTFDIPPPTLPTYPLPEPLPSSHIPAETAHWSPALQPAVLIEARAPLRLWGALAAGGERRSTGDLGIGVGASGGVAMLDARLGGGMELTAHSPSRLSAERAWQTWGLAGVVWGLALARLVPRALVE